MCLGRPSASGLPSEGKTITSHVILHSLTAAAVTPWQIFKHPASDQGPAQRLTCHRHPSVHRR